MTPFEEFAKEIGVDITTDKEGFYTKHCAALAKILTEIMFTEIDEGTDENMTRTKHKAAEEFYRQFPYMRKKGSMIYAVYVNEPEDGFYGCIGEYKMKEEAEKRANEARRARNPIYNLDVFVEEYQL